jgi:hypothetical protein
MHAVLDLDDLTRLNQGPLEQMAEFGSKLDPANNTAQAAFHSHVVAVQAVLKQTYKAAALLAKRSADCEEAASVWKKMRDYADYVIITLSILKDRFPQSGTAELHDLALDYRTAAEKRYQSNLEATLCQKTPLPEGLLPPLISPV